MTLYRFKTNRMVSDLVFIGSATLRPGLRPEGVAFAVPELARRV
jgi:hypothetical protein